MRKFKKSDSIPELARARERFDRWRSGRKHRRERIPDRLWRLGVELAETYGINRTARALGLGAKRLKERVGERRVSPAVKFMQVTPGVAPFVGWSVVEIERPGGAKLCMELRGGEAWDIAGLARDFLEAGE